MTLKNSDQIRDAFQAFIDARANLLDAAYDACVQKGLYPNMRNMWNVVLVDLFGMAAGEKAMDLCAGLMQITEDHLKRADLGVQFDEG